MSNQDKVKVGDVWQSRGGFLKIKVEKVKDGMARWTGVNQRNDGCCSVHSFDRKRVLIERDGRAVVNEKEGQGNK